MFLETQSLAYTLLTPKDKLGTNQEDWQPGCWQWGQDGLATSPSFLCISRERSPTSFGKTQREITPWGHVRWECRWGWRWLTNARTVILSIMAWRIKSKKKLFHLTLTRLAVKNLCKSFLVDWKPGSTSMNQNRTSLSLTQKEKSI